MTANLLAVQNADVLRALEHLAPDTKLTEFARSIGRDHSNLGKTLAKLREAGLVAGDALALVPDGRAMLPRLAVLDGTAPLLEGFAALAPHEMAPHPLNPRKSFDEAALDDLRQDILQSGGLTSSLLVRPIRPGDDTTNAGSASYWIVAGERRWRAVRLAQDDGDLPVGFRLPCQVREMTDAEHLRLSIGENIQRVDLDHVELGRQFEALLHTREDTPQTLAERLSKTPEYVQQHVRILRLDEEQLEQVRSGEMTFKQALALVAKPRPKDESGPELDLGAPPKAKLTDSIATFGQARLATPAEPAPSLATARDEEASLPPPPAAPSPPPVAKQIDIEPEQAKEISMLETAAHDVRTTMIGKHCVVRTYSAGVHLGEVVGREGTAVLLKDARRLWKWNGAFTLSEVASKGVSKTGSRIAVSVPLMELTEAVEIIPTTEAARATFDVVHE